LLEMFSLTHHRRHHHAMSVSAKGLPIKA